MTMLSPLRLDEAQFGNAPQADELARAEPARGMRHHQLGAAGDRRPLAGRGGKQIEHRGQAAGRDQLVRFGITAHVAPRSV